ncbi:MAG: 16S rRNA (cytidine(1402)-2'-O)-methyltransferase [candidate division KSB1 bacterium]|jgi:16S rRNA (cytidine1402-2'-O)-methyltransferase|nr:16S rRNA (cytidine(1402)-2'-O)-methyltransferase [candidate division KSB1 bacterium]
MESHEQIGRLFIVSTPIGNLKDITLRALEILEEVDLIAAEDTRRTAILLKHYNISTRTTSFFDFNKERKAPLLVEQLRKGQSIAVVSDAGTPGISDPAFYLIRLALEENIPVEAIPGATAFVPALIVSGLPTDRFIFEGFLPHKKGRRRKLEKLKQEERTIILYESPKRINRTLKDLFEYLGNRKVSLARELTKKYEQVYRGTLEEFCSSDQLIKQKGEFVIVVKGNITKEGPKN